MKCRQFGCPTPKKFRIQKDSEKVLLPVLWEYQGVTTMNFLIRVEKLLKTAFRHCQLLHEKENCAE